MQRRLRARKRKQRGQQFFGDAPFEAPREREPFREERFVPRFEDRAQVDAGERAGARDGVVRSRNRCFFEDARATGGSAHEAEHARRAQERAFRRVDRRGGD